MVIDRVSQLSFRPADLPPSPPTRAVLMADPAHFDVRYVINPHMEGQIGRVDRALAVRQWEALRDTWRGLGLEVHVIPAVEGLPDLVFTANPSFPVRQADGRLLAVMSRMRSEHRTEEVAVTERFYAGLGVATRRLPIPPEALLEGMGDLRWHPGRQLLYGGWGFRTDRATYDALVAELGLPVVALRLVDEAFYHLDTCFCPLTEDAALYVPSAFDDDGRALLAALFPRLLEIPRDEAMRFAGNGACPDGRHLVVQSGNPRTAALARSVGVEVIALETSEFLKSGGSVFCMTLPLP